MALKRFLSQQRECIVQEQSVPSNRRGEFIADLLKDFETGRCFFRSDRGSRLCKSDGDPFTQPVDSLFRLMMYRSDNFYAEQTPADGQQRTPWIHERGTDDRYPA